MKTLIDPRGPLVRLEQVPLSSRGGELDGSVVLFDNGKCNPEFGSFHLLYDELHAGLKRRRISASTRRHASSGGYSHLNPEPAELCELVQSLIDANPQAVILMVCDVGVSYPTISLAIALEAAGIRTVSLCTRSGIEFARALARSRCPQLPIVEVDQPQVAQQADAERIVQGVMDPILDALCKPAEPAQTVASNSQALPPQNGRGTLELTDAADLFGLLQADGLGDGLPVVLPTTERVDALLAAVGSDADKVLFAQLEPSCAPLTVRTLAANAALAGCEPAQFPVVLAAMRAAGAARYRYSAANVTTHGSGNMVLVSGPAAQRAGINAGAGCLGPGAANRANLAVGRTLTLVAHNVGRAVLGGGDMSILGTPAEISYCFAESADGPWPTLAEESGYPAGCVTLAKCEGPHNVLDQISQSAEDLLRGFAMAAATGATNNSFTPGELFVILNLEHAKILAGSGWSKGDIREYIFRTARVPRNHTRARGIVPSWPEGFDRMDPVPVVRNADDVFVIVAGGLGVQSAVIVPWGYNRSVTVPIEA